MSYPASGRTEWLLLPTVTAEVFTIALAQFAQAVGAGESKRILLVLDRAGWHTSQELVVPEGIHLLALFTLFARTAADVERWWPLSNEGWPIGCSTPSTTCRQLRRTGVLYCRTKRS
jgi:hypothetical protein